MIENRFPDARRATASPPPLASLTTRMFLEEVFLATQNRPILTRILPRTVRVVSLHTLERGSWQKTGWSFSKPSRDKLIFPLAVHAEEALPRTSPPHDRLLNSLRRGDPPGIGTQPRTPAASSSPPATPSDPSTTSKMPLLVSIQCSLKCFIGNCWTFAMVTQRGILFIFGKPDWIFAARCQLKTFKILFLAAAVLKLVASRRRGQEVADLGGRTSEQGKDYLIGLNN